MTIKSKPLPISSDDAWNRIFIDFNLRCKECEGTGEIDPEKAGFWGGCFDLLNCPACNGTGKNKREE